MIAPIVKWVGGKTKLLPELLARMPATYGRYYEPFAGGAALFFRVAPERAVLADLNGDLMQMYSDVAAHPDRVEGWLRIYEASHNPGYYAAMRDAWNAAAFSVPRAMPHVWAAVFIYLNRACYNGLWRVNQAGEFNAPMGRYATLRLPSLEHIAAVSARLTKDVALRCGPYQQTMGDIGRGDFVYFDPPYDGNFAGYTMSGFDQTAQTKLADYAERLVERGCRVMLSNSDTKFTRKLYRDRGFKMDRVTCGRAINSNPKKRGAVGEVIATAGYKPPMKVS